MKSVDEPIRTERLVLRPLTAVDLDDVFAYQSLPEVVEFMFWEVRTREESGEHLTWRSTLTSLEHDGDVLVLAIVLPGEPSLSGHGLDRVIGDVTVFLRSTANRHAEIGWVLHPDFQGRGFAAEAAGRMLDFAFTELDAHRVTADLDPRNAASAALAARLGMRQEAHFREDVFTKGAFADTAIYAIVRSEWAGRSLRTLGEAPAAIASTTVPTAPERTAVHRAVHAPDILPPIRVAAPVLIRERRMLMVTARGRDVLFLPGGKIDAGETPAEAVVRESREEVALELDEPSIRSLFTIRVQAHGEPEGRMVEMTLFEANTLDEPTPSAEVDAMHWVTSADAFRCPPAGVETLARLRGLGRID